MLTPAESGRAHYLKEHIPGAGFIDLLDDWSDAASPFNNTLLAPVALAKAIGDTGISADHRVVLYSSGHIMWATRAWWCLHYAGAQKYHGTKW
jgi:thiosulfate/3-mercaptopyruvate sulfurtransferase